MGIIVKTDTHCFGIDIHHRLAEKLVPYLEFVCVTHNHIDHSTVLFLKAMNDAGKIVYSNFFSSYGGYFKGTQQEIQYGNLTIQMYESDHNEHLRNFVMPFEIVCGKERESCVLFHSGDTCDANQLHPQSKRIDFHIVHPYVGLNVTEAAVKTVQAEVTLIGHLQEMYHPFNQFRWSYQQGYKAAERIRAVGKKSYVPMWGEKITWKPGNQ